VWSFSYHTTITTDRVRICTKIRALERCSTHIITVLTSDAFFLAILESYNEVSGKFVAKKSSINHDIDAMRHRATRALLTRNDVVIVASISCIYGLGLPEEYLDASKTVTVGDPVGPSPQGFMDTLEAMLYQRATQDDEFGRGTYQNEFVGTERCDIHLWPPHEGHPLRIVLERRNPTRYDEGTWFVSSVQLGNSAGHEHIESTRLFPAKHHVMSEDRVDEACLNIEEECAQRVKELTDEGKHEEANRLQQRVYNDLLMMRETGYCSGAENYSRHLAGRLPGHPPSTLMDYLSLQGRREWLLMIDESHVTLPQLRSMYAGDRSRKEKLVKHGFRLPSALDNRPLKEPEFWERVQRTVFISATPSHKEINLSTREPVKMIVRPTFVCDPAIVVKSREGQLNDLLEEAKLRATRQERTLAVTLTKRDAEDLADYLNEHGVSCTYIHCGLNTQERADALKCLQNGEVDVLVGVNLLREGLDLPQVSLVAVLNADSEVSEPLW
jgi:excinuclease ABC subunit B